MMTESHPQDPIAAVTHPNPYPYYADLVAHRPLYYDDSLKMWVASSAEVVTAVLTSDLYRVRPAAEPIPHAIVGSSSGDIFQHLIRMNDGEKHTPMKQAVSATLHTGLIDHMNAQSRQCAISLFKSLNLASSSEKIMQFAFHLPVYVVASLLGVPEERLDQTAHWVGDFVRGLAPTSTSAQIEQGHQAADQLRRIMPVLLADPHESRLASLNRESAHIDTSNQEAIAANAIGLMMQSYEATAGLIGTALITLARHATIYEHVINYPGLLRPLLHEVLRYDSPVQNTRRFVVQDGRIAGHEMKAGDTILVVLAAANRDPSANHSPHQFDLWHENRCLFTFGRGVHACPGEMMAVTIAQAALETILTSSLEIEIWAGETAYRPSANTRIPSLDAVPKPHLKNTHFYF